MNDLAKRRRALALALDGAAERGEFTLHYQPQLDMTNGDLVGAEALIRWECEHLGRVSPGEFIPILESSEGINSVTHWVTDTAAQQARQWEDRGMPLVVSVNISARQFEEDDVEGMVNRALKAAGLSAKRLGIELTEGLLIRSTPEIRTCLTNLRNAGIKVSVDDFGTGYASLAYVKKFPMDTIKIDREFVCGLPVDTENAAICNSIVALAHSLGMSVVAEGVETEGEEEFLRSINCNTVQGFLRGRPMPPEQFEAWAKERERAATPVKKRHDSGRVKRA